MRERTLIDPSGRVVVHLHDDSGKPYKFVSNALSFRGNSQFTELISIPLREDEHASPPRPSLVRGQIIITAQIVFDVGTGLNMCAADVQVDGYIGSTPTTIARTMLGGFGNTGQVMRVTFQEDDTFDNISISARQIFNFVPSNATGTTVVTANISALAYMWS